MTRTAWTLPSLVFIGGMLLAPRPVTADYLTFEVHEGAVPGAESDMFSADGIHGVFEQAIEFDGSGGFSSASAAVLSFYSLGLVFTPGQLGPASAEDDNRYQLYALFSAAGIAAAGGLVATSGMLSLYIDPARDTTTALPVAGGSSVTTENVADDILVLSSSYLLQSSQATNAFVQTFAVLPGDVTESGLQYWPTFTGTPLVVTLRGTFDPVDSAGRRVVSGDVSLMFEAGSPVPEPGPTMLIAMALAAAGLARRYRYRVR